MEWTQQFFDKTWLDYGFELVSAEDTQREVDFIEKALNLRKGETVLDLCCGIGRHSIALARKDYTMTGMDFNPDYIKRAQSLSLTLRVRPTFIQGDMRKIPFANKFDAAICIWSSFGFYSDDTDLGILKGLAKALKPGARFLLDIINRDFVLRHFRPRDWTKAGRGYVMEKRVYYSDTSRMATTWYFAGEGRITRKQSDMRLYGLHEIEAVLANAGFRVTERFGDLNRARPGFDAPRLLLVSSTQGSRGKAPFPPARARA
jgi:ubiquinone/menaquinone biosynthesis C-methylase UbiE